MKYNFDTIKKKLFDENNLEVDYNQLANGSQILVIRYNDANKALDPVLCKTKGIRGHPTKDWIDIRSYIDNSFKMGLPLVLTAKPMKDEKVNLLSHSNGSFSNDVKTMVVPFLESAIKKTFEIAKQINNFECSLGFEKSKKIESEWLSHNFAKQIKLYIEQCPLIKEKIGISVGKSDNDVDIYFYFLDDSKDYPLEIKVTCSNNWRGGEFSKRESDHLMIYWSRIEDKVKLFACITYLDKNDWVSSMQKGKRYYAPNVYRHTLATKTDRVDIIGKITKYTVSGIRNNVTIDFLDI